ncbi:MAG TPA: hypothetical protein VHI33_05495 [Solirubrobacterales bacterium]|jgi:hypothetical protein|nr:hypothetical protein [Solirubrobacterales bacterium]
MTAGDGKTVLAFLVEVAGGRRLLEALRERTADGETSVAIAAPQNQPAAGQIVDQDEIREAAQSRVEVTQAVLAEFGIDAVGVVMDPDPPLALDDAVRAFSPSEILISCLAGTRFGLLRRDLVEWARSRYEAPVIHIPVRIEDDAVRWGVTHTLVVATQTVDSPDLLERLKARAAERPHRYTIISPRSGQISRAEVCEKLARTLAELYKADIDATGQPMSPEPVAAVRNAIEHYRIDEILISTFAGQSSKWLEEGLIEKVKEMAPDKPVEHVESGRGVTGAPAPAAAAPVEGS